MDLLPELFSKIMKKALEIFFQVFKYLFSISF